MMQLIGGHSEKNRISFYTIERKVSAIRKENGSIEFSENDKDNVKGLSGLVWIFICMLKVYAIIPLIQKGIIGMAWYLFPAFFIFIWAIEQIVGLKSKIGEEGLQNHGAEHKVFKAYYKLKRIPTIEEAKQYSRISRYCRITQSSSIIVVQLIGFAFYACIGYRISEIVLYVGAMFLHSLFPFNLMGKLAQFVTTKEPKDENLELAIAALSELKRREDRKEWISKVVNTALKK